MVAKPNVPFSSAYSSPPGRRGQGRRRRGGDCCLAKDAKHDYDRLPAAASEPRVLEDQKGRHRLPSHGTG
jgi:hypothetical protein